MYTNTKARGNIEDRIAQNLPSPPKLLSYELFLFNIGGSWNKMAVSMQEPNQENQADRYPLLMEPQENNENQVHFIDIERGCDASSSGSSHNGSPCGSTLPHHEDRLSNSVRVVPITQSTSSSSNESNSRNSSVTRRGEGSGRRHWSPFNTVLWLSVELVFTVGQIIAAIIVLSVSGHENPQTPLFAWIVGYAVGCAASVPLLFWRYLNRNQGTEQGSTQLRQDSSQGNSTSEPNSYITISLTRASEEEDGQNTSSGTRTGQIMGAPNARLSALMDHLKMALDCFFAVWFVVGNVWIFGGNSSFSDAPNLYRLLICCCLPCVISFLGVRDDMNRMRGASEETINALPTHKFKLKDKGSRSNCDSNPGVDEGGFVAAGTERERVISGEDASEELFAAQINIHVTETRLIIGNKPPLNFATSLLLGVAFESKLEPVPEEEDDDEPDEVEAEVGSESVVELMLLESTPASLKIFASGESGHLKCQSGIDREAHRRISALLDKNTQTFWLGTLHFQGVVAALLGRLLGRAAHEWNAGRQVGKLVGAFLLIFLHHRHCCHHQHQC
ncbi:unnamed protein product [Camellia sinensis]